jgi:hypothetical protein
MLTNVQSRKIPTSLLLLLMVHASVTSATTSWLPMNGGEWGNATNWSLGVPDSFTDASLPWHFVFNQTNVIDLGGQTRYAATVVSWGGIDERYRLQNGTLDTSLVDGLIDIAANLTNSSGGELRLGQSSNSGVSVSGSIFGPIAVRGDGILAGNNTYTGITTVEGTLVLTGAISGSPLIEIGADSRLAINSQAPQATGAAVVRLDGGTISCNSNLGRFDLASGVSTAQTRLSVNAITRNGGLLNVDIPATPSPQQLIAVQDYSASTPLSGDGTTTTRKPVAPWITGNMLVPGGGTEHAFAVYDAATGLHVPNPISELAATLQDGENVRLTSSPVQSTDVSPNSLILSHATLTLNATLTFPSGCGLLLNSQSAIVGSGTIRVDHEVIVRADNGRIDVPMLGSGKLTISGAFGSLTINRSNTFTGGSSLHRIGLTMVEAGLGSGAITVDQSGLKFTGSQVLLTNDLIISGSRNTVSTATVAAGQTLTMTGRVKGDRQLAILGAGSDSVVHLAGESQPEDGAFLLGLGIRSGSGNTITGYLDGHYTNSEAVLWTSGIGNPQRQYLRGLGTFLGTVNPFDATVAPGASASGPGQLTFGHSEWIAATYLVELFGRDPAQYDRIVVNDSLSFRPQPNQPVLSVVLDFTPHVDDQFTVIDNRFFGPMSGTFSGLSEGTVFSVSGVPMRITYLGGDGNDVVLTVVPEPALLTSIALLTTLPARRRRSA